jgi:tripartite ATP-independent transporter DctP family solute receptor
MRRVPYRRPARSAALATAVLLVLAACNGGDGDSGDGEGDSIELSFAHSYTTDHPHHRCGAQLVADTINGRDLGMTVKVFPNSQLGRDADRFNSVSSGDIDIDIQGSSALGASFPPIGVLDTAYAFDGADHLFTYFDSDGANRLKEEFREATQARVLSAWYFGMRHFTANKPIRAPDDLGGLRMRFPDSPTYLANAKALGATATAVAFEEVFISLQQGVIDGQENPLPTIDELNLPEVQSHVSLSGHQTGSQLIVISEKTWGELSGEQQEALGAAVDEAQTRDRECVEEAERDLLAEWKQSGKPTIVEDVDRDAFAQRAQQYFEANLTGRTLEVYREVRAMAP